MLERVPMACNGLLLLYPLVVHAAVVTDLRWLEFAALVLLAGNVLGPKLVQVQAWAWGAFAAAVAASMVFVMAGEGRLFLYAASVLSPLALMWFFARTLLPRQEPLVTRIADSMGGPLSQPELQYTRRVTQLWVVAFAGFASANFLLALWAAPVTWSLFANFINYLLAGALFVAEWLFRCWYRPGDHAMTWREYVAGMVRVDIRRLLA